MDDDESRAPVEYVLVADNEAQPGVPLLPPLPPSDMLDASEERKARYKPPHFDDSPPPARRTEQERAATAAAERLNRQAQPGVSSARVKTQQSTTQAASEWPACLGFGPLDQDEVCARCECKAFCGSPHGPTAEIRSKRKCDQRRLNHFFAEVHRTVYGSKNPNLYAYGDLATRVQVNCLRDKIRPELFLLYVLLYQYEQDPEEQFALQRVLHDWDSSYEVRRLISKKLGTFDAQTICDFFDHHPLINQVLSLLQPAEDAANDDTHSSAEDGRKKHIFARSVAAALNGDAEAAILYRHVRYWCELNKSQKKQHNFHEGRYWTYDSLDAFHNRWFPYMSRTTISRKLAKLRQAGYISFGSFNRRRMDKTRWYSARVKDRNGEEISGEPNVAFVVEEAVRFDSVIKACVLYLIRRRINMRLDEGLEGQIILGTDDFCSLLPFTRRTIRRAIVDLLRRPEVGMREAELPQDHQDYQAGARRRDRRLNPKIYSFASTIADTASSPEPVCQIETSVDHNGINPGQNGTSLGQVGTDRGQAETTIPMEFR